MKQPHTFDNLVNGLWFVDEPRAIARYARVSSFQRESARICMVCSSSFWLVFSLKTFAWNVSYSMCVREWKFVAQRIESDRIGAVAWLSGGDDNDSGNDTGTGTGMSTSNAMRSRNMAKEESHTKSERNRRKTEWENEMSTLQCNTMQCLHVTHRAQSTQNNHPENLIGILFL